jgi:glutamine---fructose-6-phosphate transaminase (isomerizing)
VETAFEREIRQQPDVIAQLVERERGRVEAIAAEVRAAQPRFALIAARGSSDNAARYAKYLFGVRHKLAVGLAAPALYTMYRSPPEVSDALVIGVSQSGQSPDVVAVVADATRQNALTIALTNEPDSPLARAATLCLPLGAGEERAVAASKTYTSQLAALAMLSAAVSGDEEPWSDLEALPDAMRAALATAEAARAGASALAGATRIAVLGRGFNFATAFEAALKLKETCYLAAEPYSWADFLHGPIAVLDRQFPVLVVAPSGAASADAARSQRRSPSAELRSRWCRTARTCFRAPTSRCRSRQCPSGSRRWSRSSPASSSRSRSPRRRGPTRIALAAWRRSRGRRSGGAGIFRPPDR